VRVLIDTTYAARAPLSGTGIYVRSLCRELERAEGVELIEVANPRRRPPAGGGLGSIANLIEDARWAVAELPRLARDHGADLVHHPLPARARLGRLPQVITVADLAFERVPQCFDRRFRTYAHLAHRAAARAADAVICVSHTTAGDVRALWGVEEARIVIAPLGPGQELAAGRTGTGLAGPASAAQPAPAPAPPAPGAVNPPRPFFLYVGDAEPRKNLGVLLEAYALYRSRAIDPLTLVLAGSAAAAAPGVRVEQRPSERRLVELYSGAAALIQPSLYEGFGLTAVEAMSAGAPVLAARSPGLLEVCAGAALWADPRLPASFAEAMTRLAADPGLRNELAGRGRARARDFSWAACATTHLRAYSLAAARGAGAAQT